MSDREMTYDLDGVFASRNQGQLIAAPAVQARTIRTPGLTQISRASIGTRMPSGFSGWMDGETDLPVVGKVSNKMLLAGAAVIGIGAFFLLKRKRK
jgi:LPXTG-motif cell wall-anchored protein